MLQESLDIQRKSEARHDQAYALIWLGYTEQGLGDGVQAQQHLAEALQISIEVRTWSPLWLALPLAALLSADRGELERAVELYTLFVSQSLGEWVKCPFFEDLAGRHIAEVAATLPPEVVAAAEARGRARDLWQTAEELLVALSGVKTRRSLPDFLSGDEPPTIELPPVVARERELSQLDDALKQALQGQGRIFFVTGEAGRGKTTLLQESARRAQEQHPDLIVAGGNCEAYTGVGDPYLPFREILSLLTGDVEAKARAGAISREQARRLWQVSAQTLPSLVSDGPDLLGVFVPAARLSQQAQLVAPAGAEWLPQLQQLAAQRANRQGLSGLNQANLFQQVAAVLRRLAQNQPLLLWLDDLQWADTGSLDLLFHLGRRLEESRILVVGAYRPADVALGRPSTPSAGQVERHPLEPLLNEFQRRFGDNQLDLRQAENRQLVEAILDSQPNRLGPAFRAALYRQTQGHALFTVETLRAMQARGDLARDDTGHWVEGPAIHWEQLPARVKGVIGERLGRLPATLQETLKIASVMGEEFTAEVVARILKIEEREVVRQLSGSLDKQHHLVRSQGSQQLNGQRLSHYRFQHNLFQNYLYQNIDEAERGYLHEDVGRELEQLYGDQAGDIAAQLARHFREAGLTAKAVAYLQQAGEQAMFGSAGHEAEAFFKEGLSLLATLPDSLERKKQELSLQTALGHTLRGTKGYNVSEVERSYNRARALAYEVGQTEQILPVLRGLQEYYSNQRQHRQAQALAQEFYDLVQQERLDLAHLVMAHRMTGITSLQLGELVSARDHFEQALALYDPQQNDFLKTHYGQDHPVVGGLNYLSLTLWYLGYPDQALARSQEALALAQTLSQPRMLAQALLCSAQLHQLGSDIELAQTQMEALMAISTNQGFPYWLLFATFFRGWALTKSVPSDQDQAEAGIAQMRQALSDYRGGPSRPHNLTLLAAAQENIGHIEPGLRTVAEALALIKETEAHLYEAELYWLKGKLLWKAKTEGLPVELRDSSPEACFLQAIEVARRQQAKSLELRATINLARLWQAQGKIAEAHKVLAEIYGWFSEGFDTPDLIEAKALLDELSVASDKTSP
jgi:predicted ATPase